MNTRSEKMPATDMQPKLTIIVPAYNVAAYVQEALDSILAQSVPPDEVIIIDDGSTDETAQILQNYTNQPNFKIIRTENHGIGPARNIGSAHASGDYIYFFDSDDLLRPQFVERIKEIINNADHRPDLILFGGENFRDENGYYSFLPPDKRTLEGSFNQNSNLLKRLYDRHEVFAGAVLYVTRKIIWSKNRINFPPGVHEDEAVIAPLIAVSKLTIVTSESFFLRRVRPNSTITSGLSSKNVAGILRVLNETQQFIAREPALVRQSLSAWRKRLASFTLYYAAWCRKTKTKIAWPQLLSALLTSRSLKTALLLPLVFIPNTFEKLQQLNKAINRKKTGDRIADNKTA